MSQNEQNTTPEGELDETQLEAVAGGDGVIDSLVAAAEYVVDQVNKAGQELLKAAGGGMVQ